MKPPNASELVGPPPHGLDEAWALKNFLGKTQEQALELCKNSAVTEDFAYMAPRGLCYYLPAALRYLQSDESTEDWAFAHGLLCSLSLQVKTPGVQGEALALIEQIADFCDTNREKFDLGVDDYVDDYLATIRKK